MLSIWGSDDRTGERVSRRALLRVGALACGGLSLVDLLRLRSQSGELSSKAAETSVIHIFCGGGPSHLDTFDMKSAAPADIRGEFRPISTNVSGTYVCEYLPRLADVMDRLAVVRSVAHAEPGHLPASHWMVTGYHPPAGTTTNLNPYCGAVVAKVRGSNTAGIPPYVSIPRRQLLGGASYLGTAYNPFTTDSDPSAADYEVRNLNPPRDLNIARLEERQGLLHELDRLHSEVDRFGEFAGLDRFSREAFEIVTGARARQAFDISQETTPVRHAGCMRGGGHGGVGRQFVACLDLAREPACGFAERIAERAASSCAAHLVKKCGYGV